MLTDHTLLWARPCLSVICWEICVGWWVFQKTRWEETVEKLERNKEELMWLLRNICLTFFRAFARYYSLQLNVCELLAVLEVPLLAHFTSGKTTAWYKFFLCLLTLLWHCLHGQCKFQLTASATLECPMLVVSQLCVTGGLHYVSPSVWGFAKRPWYSSAYNSYSLTSSSPEISHVVLAVQICPLS